MDKKTRRHFLATAAALIGGTLAAPALRASAPRRVVIVGGGWGGLSAARHLRAAAPELEVVLIERNSSFQSLPLSNPWLAGLPGFELATRDYAAAAAAFGYRRVQASVTAIDRERRQVHSSAGRLDYDWLVLACGIREDYSAWFGDDRVAAGETRRRYGSAFAAGPDLAAVRERIASFAGGDFLMNIPAGPYRCPPAPYERALCIAEMMKRRRIKGRLVLLDPGPGLLGFPRRFAEHYPEQVVFVPHAPVRAVDPLRRVVSSEVDDYPFAEAILMPPQQAGELAWQAGLVDPASAWGNQDSLRLHARGDERVFLVGDLIGKVSSLFGQYTKSGHVAASLGRIAALEIAARARGREAPVQLPESLCLVSTGIEPPELLRVEADYRRRGEVIVQNVRQQREAQPRGEDRAWLEGQLSLLFG